MIVESSSKDADPFDHYGTTAAVVALTCFPVIAAPSHAEIDKTDNIHLEQHHPFKGATDPYSGGSELASDGRLLFAAQLGHKGGVHVFDRSRKKARRLSFIPCPGEHAGVEVVSRGVIAIAHEAGACSSGIALYDVRDATKPRRLGDVALDPHTITVYPGRPFIYVSPNGLGKNQGREYIVDASNPSKPEIVGSFQPNPAGCHDLEFFVSESEQLAVCVGGGEGQVWDVSDPVQPRTIGHIPVVGTLPHSVAISPDGALLAIGEEALGECATVTGSLQLYDFTIREAPTLLAHYETPYDTQGTGVIDFCSPNFAFVPETSWLVTTWGATGITVLDLTDPRFPTEVAHYVGKGDDRTYYWGLEYWKGRIWINDRTRGLDVLRVSPQG